jgi:hypothetical protein
MNYELHENDTDMIRTNVPFASSIVYELLEKQEDHTYYLQIIFNG